jgi:hypothetical protein
LQDVSIAVADKILSRQPCNRQFSVLPWLPSLLNDTLARPCGVASPSAAFVGDILATQLKRIGLPILNGALMSRPSLNISLVLPGGSPLLRRG